MSDSPERVSIETQPPSQEVLEALQSLIPGAVSDGVIDAQRIGEAAGLPVAGIKDGAERFGLMWAGKSKAVEALQAPSMAALSPDMENSINWDTAENVFIEGDNLEVLKLLQKAYNDQVKLIYIDPPYNTGNDFVYNDDFSQPLKHYLEVTGQVDAEGNRLVANTEVSGRKHSNWLSMMYPRLVLARNVLERDGAIFVAIDHNEFAHLKCLMDEVFGPENFVGEFIWAAGRKNDSKLISTSHEYMIVYARDLSYLVESIGGWKAKKEGLDSIYRQVAILAKTHSSNWIEVSEKLKLWFASLADNDPAKRHALYWRVDEGGPYRADNVAAPDKPETRSHRPLIHPVTGKPCATPKLGWRWVDSTVDELLSRNRFIFGPDETTVPQIKGYLKEREHEAPYSVFYKDGSGATRRLRTLLGGAHFDNPKDEEVLRGIIEFACGQGGVVLDFFAGSGTTAHAVWLQNAKDLGARRFILVNLPETTKEDSVANKSGFKTVSEITRFRLRKVMEELPSALAAGLRCFKLSGSNFYCGLVNENDSGLLLFQNTLNDLALNDNISTEVFLKNGVRLDKDWKRIQISEESAVVSDGVCVVLARELSDNIVEAAKLLEEAHTVIFLEDAFAGRDAVKANAVLGFKQANKIMKTV